MKKRKWYTSIVARVSKKKENFFMLILVASGTVADVYVVREEAMHCVRARP